MQQILNRITDFIGKNKEVLLFFKNGDKIYVNISENDIPHLLGLKHITFYKNNKPSQIVKKIREGNITLKIIESNTSISKNDKKMIRNKVLLINLLIDKYKNINNSSVYRDIIYKQYKADFVFRIENIVLCFKITSNINNKYKCCLLSTRILGPNTNEVNRYIDEYSIVKKTKYIK